MDILVVREGKLIVDGGFGQFLLVVTCFKKWVGVISNHL